VSERSHPRERDYSWGKHTYSLWRRVVKGLVIRSPGNTMSPDLTEVATAWDTVRADED
jgi:hypothetical protein